MELLIASTYSDVRPVLNCSKVYAPTYKAYANPGSFITLNQQDRSVFRIINTNNSNILVNEFIFKEDISSLSTTATNARNDNLSMVQEVAQTMNTY